jgi:hypothetical protein
VETGHPRLSIEYSAVEDGGSDVVGESFEFIVGRRSRLLMQSGLPGHWPARMALTCSYSFGTSAWRMPQTVAFSTMV